MNKHLKEGVIVLGGLALFGLARYTEWQSKHEKEEKLRAEMARREDEARAETARREESRAALAGTYEAADAVLIDSNLWMSQSSSVAIERFFEEIVRPSGKPLTMLGEQLEEIDRRRKASRSGDPDSQATMSSARHAIREIERQASKKLLRVDEIKDKTGSNDFDSFAMKNIVEPTIGAGKLLLVLSDDLVFRTRIHSFASRHERAKAVIFNMDTLNDILVA